MIAVLPEGYAFVTDPDGIDLGATHAYLTRSYWAAGIPLETVKRALANSFCVAITHQGAQIAFARLVSDRATFAYLADVYVLEEHRGKGLSHAILDFLQGHPEFQGLRRWALFTRDAQGLYAVHGWKEYPNPDRMMTIDDPGVYR